MYTITPIVPGLQTLTAKGFRCYKFACTLDFKLENTYIQLLQCTVQRVNSTNSVDMFITVIPDIPVLTVAQDYG